MLNHPSKLPLMISKYISLLIYTRINIYLSHATQYDAIKFQSVLVGSGCGDVIFIFPVSSRRDTLSWFMRSEPDRAAGREREKKKYTHYLHSSPVLFHSLPSLSHSLLAPPVIPRRAVLRHATPAHCNESLIFGFFLFHYFTTSSPPLSYLLPPPPLLPSFRFSSASD